MELLVSIVFVLIISAFIVDWLLKDKANLFQIQNTSNDFEEKDSSELIEYANSQFRSIFDAIYGEKTWTRKRFFRSTVMSVFFVLFAILLIDIDNTYIGSLFAEEDHWLFVVLTTLVMVCINIFVDFLSLQETRWVIGHAKGNKLTSLAFWVIVDIVFSSAIYIFVFSTVIFTGIGILDNFNSVLKYVTDLSHLSPLFKNDKLLPFFISTFGTSIVWYVFVLFSITVKTLRINSTRFDIVFNLISKSNTPARITVVIFALPTFMLIGLWEAVDVIHRWFLTG